MRILLFICLLFYFSASYSFAQVTVHYQGQVTNSAGAPIANIPVQVSPDAGNTFISIGASNMDGYYSGSFIANGNYFMAQTISCAGSFVTVVTPWNGIDTSISFQPLVYCNVSTDTFSLCINAYLSDTNATDTNYFKIFLIKSENTTNGDSLYLAATDTIATGQFACFNGLVGTYYTKAMMLPNSPLYGHYIPTYHIQTFMWVNALQLNNNSLPYQNISLLAGIPTAGPGFVGGLVSQGANRLENEYAIGDPAPGIDIFLTNTNNQVIKHSQTGIDGTYHFSNLSYGTYLLWADVLNKPCQAPISVTLSTEQSEVTNTEFSIGPDMVTGYFTSNKSSLQEQKQVRIVTNPAQDNLKLSINGFVDETLCLNVTDLLGRLIMSYSIRANNEILIPVDQLCSGIYFITFDAAAYNKTLPFVKQ